jgi:hypothetical protein
MEMQPEGLAERLEVRRKVEEQRRKETWAYRRAAIFETVITGVAIGALMASPTPIFLRIGLVVSLIVILRKVRELQEIMDTRFNIYAEWNYFSAKFLGDRLNAMIGSPELASELSKTSYATGFNELAERQDARQQRTSESATAELRKLLLAIDIFQLLAGAVVWFLLSLVWTYH